MTPSSPGSDNHPLGCALPRLGLLIVVLLAAATRFIGLGSLDVWMDEVYSHEASSDLLTKLLRWETKSNESSSPLPFIEQKVTRRIFGEESPLSLRVPSAIHGVITAALLYLILGRLAGWGAAFFAALLLAINPFALEWSREGRMYTQWTTATLLLVAAAYEAMRWTRTGNVPAPCEPQPGPLPAKESGSDVDPAALNWRWWLVGICFIYVHAMNVMGVFTIAGVGLWLGLMGLLELPRDGRAGLRILLGAALATGVYLCSWALTGIAKALMLSANAKAARDFVPPELMNEVSDFLQQISGHVSLPVALILWLLVAAGVALLVLQGRGRIAALIVMASLGAWAGFPGVAKSHFFAPRYVYTGVIVYCAGLGALCAWLWRGNAKLPTQLTRAVAVVIIVAAAALAWPFTYEVFFVPKMEIRKALAPIQRHAEKGDVLIVVPDYYESLASYKPYEFGENVTVIRGPREARYGTKPDSEYKGLFEDHFAEPSPRDGAQPEPKPPGELTRPPRAAWLFLLIAEGAAPPLERWDARLRSVQRVLAAYDLTPADLKAHVSASTYTLTVRLTRDADGRARIEHATSTIGRRFR